MNRFAAVFLCTGSFFAIWCSGADTCGHNPTGFTAFLLAKGDIDAAALEYERLRAAGQGDSTALGCTLGELYLRTDPAKAEIYFNEACERGSRDTALRVRAEQGLILAYLLQRKSVLARNELAEFTKGDSVPLAPAARAFLKCLIDASLYLVDSARAGLFFLSKDTVYSRRAARIDDLLAWYRKQGLKDPTYTYLYASAVPGWGQWYNNDKKGAVAAFGLMATLSGIIVWDGYRFYRGDTRLRYVCGMDIFLLGGLLWRRYQGSIRKAAYNQSLAINANIQLEYQKRLRSILCME